MLIVFAFLICALLVFGLIVFLVRPTSDQKAVHRRIAAVKVPQGTLARESEDLQKYLKTLQRGSFGWMEDLVDGSAIQRRIQLLVIQADQTTPIGNVLRNCAGLGMMAGAVTYLMTSNLIFAVVATLTAAYLPIAVLGFKRSRRINKFNGALPDCIDMMARALRAGHALNAAIAIVSEQSVEPARSEWREVFRKQNYGMPMRDALMQLLDRVPSQDLRVLVTGMLVQKDTGGNLAEILDRILHVIRERVRIKGEIKTHTAQGRMTGWILCALPVIMLALINMINPGYSKVLFEDPTGQKLLYAGVALLAIGAFIINKIVSGIEV